MSSLKIYISTEYYSTLQFKCNVNIISMSAIYLFSSTTKKKL